MMIFDANSLPLQRDVKACVDEFRAEGAKECSTIDLLRKYLGRYHVDHTTPDKSFNANFGKFLSEKADMLGIEKIREKQHEQDDDGNDTCTADWRIL